MTREQIEKKAIDLCEKEIGCEEEMDCTYCPYKDFKKVLSEMADWALSHQWVSVKEELPPQMGRYSKYVIMRNRIGGHYIGCYDFVGEMWMDEHLEYIYMDITHWMPIPPMAEEGGGK